MRVPFFFRGPLAAVLAVALLVPAAGCKGPLELALTVAGDAALNSGGNAAIVGVYQLNSRTNFERTPIETFWQDDERALAGELVLKQQHQLLPGQVLDLNLVINETTRFIGVAADLRRPDRDHWRVVYPVEDLKGKATTVVIGSDRITLRLP